MNTLFIKNIGGYYNNRTMEIGHAGRILGTTYMSNSDPLSYGLSKSGHLIVNVRSHDRNRRNTVNIVFNEEHMVMYHATSSGIIIPGTPRKWFDYVNTRPDGIWGDEFIWDAIKQMLAVDVSADFAHISCHNDDPVHIDGCNCPVFLNIEQLREAYLYLSEKNMGFGHAFYGFNDMHHLIVWLGHHPSINYSDITDDYKDFSIIAEFEGDGIVKFYDADKNGRAMGSRFGWLDDHSDGVRNRQHEKFVEMAKSRSVMLI